MCNFHVNLKIEGGGTDKKKKSTQKTHPPKTPEAVRVEDTCLHWEETSITEQDSSKNTEEEEQSYISCVQLENLDFEGMASFQYELKSILKMLFCLLPRTSSGHL